MTLHHLQPLNCPDRRSMACSDEGQKFYRGFSAANDVYTDAAAAVQRAKVASRPAEPSATALDEAAARRIDAARHALKSRAGGWAYEQARADHAQRRDGL